MSYEDYEQAVAEADKWFVYQQTLVGVQVEIAKLIYAFNMGEMSLEYGTALCMPFVMEANDAIAQLFYWHSDMTTQFDFTPDKTRRRRMGAGGALMSVPGVFNDNLNYVTVKPETTRAIQSQLRSGAGISALGGPDLYQQDVNLVLTGGRIYYLPDAHAVD